MSRVGLVVVSHSKALAAAAVELALQMVADDPPKIEVAAGTADGGLGTDATAVMAAIERADAGAGVAVFVDLGSAVMSAELALEMLAEHSEVRILAAPLVEGLVAAAVLAAGGSDLAAIATEAESALAAKKVALGQEDGKPAAAAEPAIQSGPTTASVELKLTNQVGLHARPAAKVVSLAGSFASEITISKQGSDRRAASNSSLALMSLGAKFGDTINIEATGEDAPEAIAALTELITSGFGEE